MAPIFAASGPRSPTLRAASAIFIPAPAKLRAIEAESPEPAPTIRATLSLTSTMDVLPFE